MIRRALNFLHEKGIDHEISTDYEGEWYIGLEDISGTWLTTNCLIGWEFQQNNIEEYKDKETFDKHKKIGEDLIKIYKEVYDEN